MQIPNEKRTVDILKFKPDRLGHCTCIHPNLQGSKQLFDMLLESKIPVGKRPLGETLMIIVIQNKDYVNRICIHMVLYVSFFS